MRRTRTARPLCRRASNCRERSIRRNFRADHQRRPHHRPANVRGARPVRCVGPEGARRRRGRRRAGPDAQRYRIPGGVARDRASRRVCGSIELARHRRRHHVRGDGFRRERGDRACRSSAASRENSIHADRDGSRLGACLQRIRTVVRPSGATASHHLGRSSGDTTSGSAAEGSAGADHLHVRHDGKAKRRAAFPLRVSG